MLVLSRKPGESIIIGNGAGAVEIMVTRIRNDKVRLGKLKQLNSRRKAMHVS